MINCTPIRAFTDNYIWFIENTASKQGVLVDPGDAEPVLNFLAATGKTIAAIIATHHHYDHTGGIAQLVEKFAIPVYGPDKLANVTNVVKGGSKISIEPTHYDMQIIAVPGHTKDHIAYYDGQRLFCGDTLFLGGCGRLFEGTAEQMWESLTKLKALPDDTQIYCAHEYTLANLVFAQQLDSNNSQLNNRIKSIINTRKKDGVTIPATLEIEKETNPFLRCKTLQDFKEIRQMKDEFSFSESTYLSEY